MLQRKNCHPLKMVGEILEKSKSMTKTKKNFAAYIIFQVHAFDVFCQ